MRDMPLHADAIVREAWPCAEQHSLFEGGWLTSLHKHTAPFLRGYSALYSLVRGFPREIRKTSLTSWYTLTKISDVAWPLVRVAA